MESRIDHFDFYRKSNANSKASRSSAMFLARDGAALSFRPQCID